jgi:hypothetical protein
MLRYFRPPNAGGKRKFILTIFAVNRRSLPSAVRSQILLAASGAER